VVGPVDGLMGGDAARRWRRERKEGGGEPARQEEDEVGRARPVAGNRVLLECGSRQSVRLATRQVQAHEHLITFLPLVCPSQGICFQNSIYLTN
jgi:hypothetical protein